MKRKRSSPTDAVLGDGIDVDSSERSRRRRIDETEQTLVTCPSATFSHPA
ncbi:hypothetical protein [Natrialba swarupiae]|nr:hypothetical protein [Natrialba swarupiae]